jgi:ubiquinone/menaquinone biosynthesis C-methylase UbiE
LNTGPEREAWERFWGASRDAGSLFDRIAVLVRRQLLSRAVRRYAARYFPPEGIFVECGCGTGLSSSRVERGRRTFVALDFASGALVQARKIPLFSAFLQGDIRRLPLRDNSVSGIWNLGVLEHFEPEVARQILREFGRVLRAGAVAILFWPPEFGSSRWVLAPIERARALLTGQTFRFFPDEVNRLRSKQQARATLAASGMEAEAVEFAASTGLMHVVVVCRKSGQ